MKTKILGLLAAAVLLPTVGHAVVVGELELAQTPNTTFALDTDFSVFAVSGFGDVTASVWNVGNVGCDASDFAGFVAGSIALISRGTCTYANKANNASAAGASGVLIYNNIPELIFGTLGGWGGSIPVLGLTQSLGQTLLATQPLTMRMAVYETPEPGTLALLGLGLAGLGLSRRRKAN